MTIGTKGLSKHTIPNDIDLDQYVIARVKVVRKRSWRRLGRKTWRMVSVDETS